LSGAIQSGKLFEQKVFERGRGGVIIPSAICPKNGPLGHRWCLLSMVDAGPAIATWSDNIYYMIVGTAITKDRWSVTITHLFVLPQGQHNLTRTNDNVHIICDCTGIDSCSLHVAMCKTLITNQTGLNVPCAMVATGFGQSRALLGPDTPYLTVQRRDRTFQDKLWTWLHTLVCPATTQDGTLSIRNVHQKGIDTNGQSFCKSLAVLRIQYDVSEHQKCP
jgi:hypothetical protein